MNVIIATPMHDEATDIQNVLVSYDHTTTVCLNGKEAQLASFKGKFNAIILDIDIKSNSAFEVIKYLKLKAPSTKIVLTFSSKKRFDELEFTKEELYKIGVSDVLTRPFPNATLAKSLDGDLQFKLKKNVNENKDGQKDTGPVTIRDDLFTMIKIENFMSGNAAIFELFLKLKSNRYLKILHAGDHLSKERLLNYKNEKKVDFLYFRTKDRGIYIHFLNDMMTKLLKKPGKSVEKKVSIIKDVTEKFVEDIFKEGIKPEIIGECDKICENLNHLVKQENGLAKALGSLKEENHTIYTHSFLVVFISTMICNALHWGSNSTIRKITLGAVFHDIGKKRLDPLLTDMDIKDMNEKQYNEYKKHPEYGVEMLSDNRLIGHDVIQIILQHHESVDGEGFPHGLPGMKIYPLAQIVSFADTISKIMSKEGSSPINAMKTFLGNKELVSKFGRKIVESFIKCLTNKP